MITPAEIAARIEADYAPGTIVIEHVHDGEYQELTGLLGDDAPEDLWAMVPRINEHLSDHAVSTRTAQWLLCPDCAIAEIYGDSTALEYREDGSEELWRSAGLPRLGLESTARLANSFGELHCEGCGMDLYGDEVSVMVRV